MASWTISAGCVAGVYISWRGIVGDRTVIDLNVRWRKGQTLEPDWQINQDGWVIQVDGQPTVTTKVVAPPAITLTVDKQVDANGDQAYNDTETAPAAGAPVTYRVVLHNTSTVAVRAVRSMASDRSCSR